MEGLLVGGLLLDDGLGKIQEKGVPLHKGGNQLGVLG
jgi:hypothetical protein